MSSEATDRTKAPFLTSPVFAFAEKIDGLYIDGNPADYPVVNERAVRATAGLTLIAASVAFVYAFFWQYYIPIKVVTVVFAIDFAIRLLFGMTPLSPFGVIGTWMVRNQRPDWVGATQKRFAWSIGLVVALFMAVITNLNVTGNIPFTICFLCMTLMWMESTLGICVGCKIYRVVAKSRFFSSHEYTPACPGGVCANNNVREAQK